MKITRRKLAASAFASAAALQTAQPQTQPAPPSEDPGELLRNAKEQVKRNSEAVTRFQLPMATEPAFQFKP